MLMCDGTSGGYYEGYIRARQGSGPLIALVQEMRHSVLDIEDHLAEHAIGPAKPVEIVSARLSVMKR